MNRVLQWVLFLGRPGARRAGQHLAGRAPRAVVRPVLELPVGFTVVPATVSRRSAPAAGRRSPSLDV